jgi:CRISPR-associated protein Csd2
MSLENRYDFVYLFDVRDGNPNGDPDAGNLPRIDPESGHGLVTDVCLKRKIRNYVELAKFDTATEQGPPGLKIYVREKAVLNRLNNEAYEALSIDPDTKNKRLPKDEQKARDLTAWMCRNFFDIRAFGAVMTTEVNCGQVRGPIQFAFARSVDPIVTLEHSITRCAVTKEADAEKERTMGRKFTVPYALYRAHGFVNARLAQKSGFSESDLALLWEALGGMFDLDRSAARGEITPRRLIAFRHESSIGNAPAGRLFDRVRIKRSSDQLTPPRHYDDYQVTIDTADLPAGISIHEPIA